jgi:hypothetical protein
LTWIGKLRMALLWRGGSPSTRRWSEALYVVGLWPEWLPREGEGWASCRRRIRSRRLCLELRDPEMRETAVRELRIPSYTPTPVGGYWEISGTGALRGGGKVSRRWVRVP